MIIQSFCLFVKLFLKVTLGGEAYSVLNRSADYCELSAAREFSGCQDL